MPPGRKLIRESIEPAIHRRVNVLVAPSWLIAGQCDAYPFPTTLSGNSVPNTRW